MLSDPLLETNGHVDSLTLEKAAFRRRSLVWKEEERQFVGRYSWNSRGLLSSVEENEEVMLYAYDENGDRIACYRMDAAGTLISRETWERNEQGRLEKRILTIIDPPGEEIRRYEYDESGRMTAEHKGRSIRVEKYDTEGLLELEYLYNGETPDLITEYGYDEDRRLRTAVIRDPGGSRHRETQYSYDEEGRLASVIITNSDGRIIRDEEYAYESSQGRRWLERVTWIPRGKRKGKRRPSEVIYRSFTLGENQSRSAPGAPQTAAFENGVYTGPLVDGYPEGRGIFRYNDSSRYEGEFRKGIMEGYGALTWADGRRMEGNFRNGQLEGRGFCIWADGSRYDGEFSEGRMHGPGVFLWADGTRFEGLFEKGKRTDQGAWEKQEDR